MSAINKPEVVKRSQTGLCTQMTAKFSGRFACTGAPALTAPRGKTDYHENN